MGQGLAPSLPLIRIALSVHVEPMCLAPMRAQKQQGRRCSTLIEEAARSLTRCFIRQPPSPCACRALLMLHERDASSTGKPNAQQGGGEGPPRSATTSAPGGAAPEANGHRKAAQSEQQNSSREEGGKSSDLETALHVQLLCLSPF